MIDLNNYDEFEKKFITISFDCTIPICAVDACKKLGSILQDAIKNYDTDFTFTEVNFDLLVSVHKKLEICRNELNLIDETLKNSSVKEILPQLTYNFERKIENFYLGFNIIELTLQETLVLYKVLIYIERSNQTTSKYKIDRYWMLFLDNFKKYIACKFTGMFL